MSIDPLVLRHGDVKVALDPAHGGAVREFSKNGLHLFRPTPFDAHEDPLLFSCFPMVPYVNRIAHGFFTHRNREIRIAPNWSGDPHPLHGQGWRDQWSVSELSVASATLTFHGGGDSWPWIYQSEQRFELRPDGLTITLSLQNMADSSMPASIGLHPYFPDASHARLEASLPRMWRTENNLAIDSIVTPTAVRFEPSRAVNRFALDNSFSDWSGVAQITWPERSLQIRASHCRHLHVYLPAAGDFFCIEPQTAAAGALNRADEDLKILEPGGRMTMQVEFTMGEV